MMNLYRCTVTKRDGSGEPKVIYLLADNPGNAEILACIDAGLSGAELSLRFVRALEMARRAL